METTKPDNSSSKSLKIVILMMALLMLGGAFYIYKMSDRSKQVIVSLRSEKAATLKDLRESQAKLEEVALDNSELSNQLVSEKAKIAELIKKIEDSKPGDNSNDLKFAQEAQAMQKNISKLTNQIAAQKRRLDSVNNVLNITKTANNELSNKNKDLQTNNKDLSSKITEAEQLNYLDLKASGYKARGSGKFTETDKSDKVDLIKVSFSIAQNKLSQSKNKKYYIQIIDSKNNVLGNKQSINFDDQTLVYSTINIVKYDNKALKVESEIEVENLAKGTYTVNIFDFSNMILTTSFDLK
jgi:predicted RNase H-like nuclease (RuvC/YqgF family)